MNDFTAQLHELFEPLGPVELRRMFGGHGVFHAGRMFAVVVRDRLYLKTDARNVEAFEALRLEAFTYARGDRTVRTSYREAPPDVFEDREAAALWGRRAWEAAARSGVTPAAPPASAPRSSPGRSPCRRSRP